MAADDEPAGKGAKSISAPTHRRHISPRRRDAGPWPCSGPWTRASGGLGLSADCRHLGPRAARFSTKAMCGSCKIHCPACRAPSKAANGISAAAARASMNSRRNRSWRRSTRRSGDRALRGACRRANLRGACPPVSALNHVLDILTAASSARRNCAPDNAAIATLTQHPGAGTYVIGGEWIVARKKFARQ